MTAFNGAVLLVNLFGSRARPLAGRGSGVDSAQVLVGLHLLLLAACATCVVSGAACVLLMSLARSLLVLPRGRALIRVHDGGATMTVVPRGASV